MESSVLRMQGTGAANTCSCIALFIFLCLTSRLYPFYSNNATGISNLNGEFEIFSSV
jgi:hypothetical protein